MGRSVRKRRSIVESAALRPFSRAYVGRVHESSTSRE